MRILHNSIGSDRDDQQAFWSERVADCKWMTTRQFFFCVFWSKEAAAEKEFARLSPQTSRPLREKSTRLLIVSLFTSDNVLDAVFPARAQSSIHFSLQITTEISEYQKLPLFAVKPRETLKSNSSHTAESSLLLLQKMQISKTSLTISGRSFIRSWVNTPHILDFEAATELAFWRI